MAYDSNSSDNKMLEHAPDGDDSNIEQTDEDILSEAKARLKLAEDSEYDTRRLFLEDFKFRAGQQWPAEIRSERDRDGRPCLVVNRIPQFIQQITNDQRQNRPSIKVSPIDDKADVETAKIIQGLIRHIEYNSNADVAYDTAFDSAATGGLGYWRIVTDYSSPTSFDQEILIKRVRNTLSVFFDPFSQEPDGSDANYALILEDLSKDEYKSRYPESKLTNESEWGGQGNHSPDWVKTDGCRVAEYFYKETKNIELALLSDGRIIPAEALPALLPEGVEVVRKRNASVPIIKWCKLNGVEILEKTDWPGSYIPIIPVYGNELYIDGKRILEGIVRNAKDPQRMYNYWKSAETEAIALAPRAPFVVAEGQLEGHEKHWESANRRNHAFLTYKPLTLAGQPVAPPQRNSFEPAVGAITQAAMFAADDMKATTGLYDAAIGAKSNETSGIAIQRRNVQSQTSNFHFIDNLTRSLKHTGRILIDLIPKIYDTARTARIIGEDGEQRIVQINQPTEESGKTVLYKMDAGKYDVTVDVGPSFASKRQEAVASMLDLTRAYPAIAQIAGDLIVKNMDWQGAQEIAERLKKTLPPGIADDKDPKNQAVPPQVQAQMKQMNAMIEQLTHKLNEAQDVMAQKTLELESKERIEFKKLEVELEIERAKLDAKDSITLLNSEISAINERLQLLKINQPFEFAPHETSNVPPQPQNFAPDSDDGAMGADSQFGAEQPTGGASPGTPMEQSNDYQ